MRPGNSQPMAKQRYIHQPLFPGGEPALNRFLEEQLQYPVAAQEAGIEGIVRVRFGIDHRGRVTQVYIESGLGYGCDEEAERVVRLLRFVVPKSQKRKRQYEKRLQLHFRRTVRPAAVTAEPAAAPVLHYTLVPQAGPGKTATAASYNYTFNWPTTTSGD